MSFPPHRSREQSLISLEQDDGSLTTPAEAILTCVFCKSTFGSKSALRLHKREMAANERTANERTARESKGDDAVSTNKIMHIYCHICDKDFVSFNAGHLHWIQNHSEMQNINCPGCDAHFLKYSGFIKHIECQECDEITKEDAAARCQKSIEFAKALGAIDAERPELAPVRGPKDFSLYLGGYRAPIKPINPMSGTRDPSGWGTPGPEAPKEKDFPRMPASPNLPPGASTNNPSLQQKTNAWASTSAGAQNLFPNAAPAQAPTDEQLGHLRAQQTAAVERARGDHTDPDHPNSRYLSAQRYWNMYTKKYKCPRDGCRKTFPTQGGLVQHLQSPAHAFKKVYTCPTCFKRFPFLFALAAHCESESLKCHIRDGDMYERFLSQLTWNLVEVAGAHERDGTLKYDISAAAKVEYGATKGERPTFGHQQVHGAGNVAKEAAPRNSGSQQRLTMDALAQHGRQQRRPQTEPAGQKPLRQECESVGGASMALTAKALAKLNLQVSHKSASAKQNDDQEDDDAAW